ncbi:MAG: M20 family metallopeptidase [Fusobacterium sp.]|nr:M20 family metallopeptidase [Fusobacterium sp.]
MKESIVKFIDSNKDKFIEISQAIHSHPELGNQEFFASNLLVETLKANGFEVIQDVAGHKTGFIARKKSPLGDKPKISFLAEYDALPKIGHGCGHNIIGSISTAAAIALGETLDSVAGEVLVYGCPAEEGGENGSSKGSFVRENLFDGVDVAMIIHPSGENMVTGKSLAVSPLDFEFFGKPAHAAGCPEKGRNALDALLHFFNGIATLRQHVTSDVRIHGIITHGGDAPNIIPEYTKARFFIRAETKERCNEVVERVKEIAKGAAIITGCKEKVSSFQNMVDNIVPTPEFDKLYVEVAKEFGIDVIADERDGRGSSDVGNVSHVIPTIQPYIKICGHNVVGHSQEFCSAAGSSEGDKAVILGAKILANVGYELLTSPEKLEIIKKDFKNRK